MPNWACANYVASGDSVELEELVRTLNTMPNLLPDTPNGFGRPAGLRSQRPPLQRG